MKKRVYLSALFSAMLLILFSACSSEENMDKAQTVDVAKNIIFKMNFVDYNAGDSIEGKTRASQTEPAKKQIIPMGDFFAEVSVERDTTKASKKEQVAATRALADGKYHLYAYQGTTQKGMMTGTMASNTFTPDGGIDGMSLLPGTYTFICVNDDVDVSGSLWKISRSKIETARMGIAENVVITPTPKLQKVTFDMKHVGSRVRVQVTMQNFFYENLLGTLSSTNDIPQTATFDPSTRSFTSYGDDAAYSESINFSDYNRKSHSYFFPSTNLSDFKLTLNSGKVYRIPITTARNFTFPSAPTTQMNGSYVLNITLMYNYIYLYSDGTTGQYTDPDFSSHTPIGLVVSRSKRLAVALKNAFVESHDGFTVSKYTPVAPQKPWSIKTNTQSNTTMSNSLSNNLADFNGEAYTYEATYSTDGIIKGQDATNYPAFYAAAHYDPGVPVAPHLKKWFLPTVGEWNLYYKNLMLTNKDLAASPNWKDGIHFDTNYNTWSYFPEDYGFSRGGGETMRTSFVVSMGGGERRGLSYYLSSSECATNNFYALEIGGVASFYWGWPLPQVFGLDQMDKDRLVPRSRINSGFTTGYSYCVRPFIHY
jgi:hypothetical protein